MTETNAEDKNTTSEANGPLNSEEENGVPEDEMISKEEFDACVEEKEKELAMARLQLEQDIRVHQAVLQLEVSKATQNYTDEMKKVDDEIQAAQRKTNVLKSSEATFHGIIQALQSESRILRNKIGEREDQINDILADSQGESLEEAFNSQMQTLRSKLEECRERMSAKDENFSSFMEEQRNVIRTFEEMQVLEEERLKGIREHLCSMLIHLGHEKMGAQNKKNEAEYEKSLLKNKIQQLDQRKTLLQKLVDEEVSVADLHDQLTEYESVMEVLTLSNQEIREKLSC